MTSKVRVESPGHPIARSAGPMPLVIAILFAAVAAGSRAAADASDDTLVIQPDRQAVLFGIDDHLLPVRSNLCLYLSKPKVRKEPVLTPSRDNPKAPDYIGAHFYGTVLRDAGRFRMWYYGLHYQSKPSDLHPGPICYAESNDGIHWTKPNLGQVDVKGSSNNNAIKLPDDQTWFAGVIRDDDDPDPQRRYKMVYDIRAANQAFRTATSADGIHWTAAEHPAINSFIEMSSFYKHNGMYVVNGQYFSASEGGHPSGRQGGAVISPNFDRWIPGYVDAFRIREPADPAKRGSMKPYYQVHLGVGGAGFGNVVVGLFGLWHNVPGDRKRDIPASWFGFKTISCDLSLVVSNDGLHFREPAKGHVFIDHHDSPVALANPKEYPTILIQSGNGILNVDDETRIYHGRWRNAEYGLDYWAEVALATLDRDRWGALGLFPQSNEGELWTAPITLPDGPVHVSINADGASGMRIEVIDENFNPLTEYSGPNSGVADGDHGLDCPVMWAGRRKLSLGKRTVRLRIQFNRRDNIDPRLFAIYITPASATAD